MADWDICITFIPCLKGMFQNSDDEANFLNDGKKRRFIMFEFKTTGYLILLLQSGVQFSVEGV